MGELLWSRGTSFESEPFENERELEEAILEVAVALFGPTRVYLDVKKRIGLPGRQQNVPDGYLIDLSSTREPRLFVVENELSRHDPLKHIAVQVLEFSLAYETTPDRVKATVKAALAGDTDAFSKCQSYAVANGFENVDYLLERMIFGKAKFNALVIIDELDEDLETVLISRFKFPVEILTLERYRSKTSGCLYRFEPFLEDVSPDSERPDPGRPVLDPGEIDTIVVPAHEEGFQETFIGETCWHHIRIHSSMIPQIKYVAVYRVAPISSITHIAPVRSIDQWQDTNKYVLYFAQPAEDIGPISLVPNGRVRAPQAPRYTSRAKLLQAKTLDEAF